MDRLRLIIEPKSGEERLDGGLLLEERRSIMRVRSTFGRILHEVFSQCRESRPSSVGVVRGLCLDPRIPVF